MPARYCWRDAPAHARPAVAVVRDQALLGVFAFDGEPVRPAFAELVPRSGTSMMMRMLESGGVPPLTDGFRSADDDNPLGYYEFEAVKRLDR